MRPGEGDNKPASRVRRNLTLSRMEAPLQLGRARDARLFFRAQLKVDPSGFGLVLGDGWERSRTGAIATSQKRHAGTWHFLAGTTRGWKCGCLPSSLVVIGSALIAKIFRAVAAALKKTVLSLRPSGFSPACGSKEAPSARLFIGGLETHPFRASRLARCGKRRSYRY
jgi:hypothetical protein